MADEPQTREAWINNLLPSWLAGPANEADKAYNPFRKAADAMTGMQTMQTPTGTVQTKPFDEEKK
jgi:hypothetical protein